MKESQRGTSRKFSLYTGVAVPIDSDQGSCVQNYWVAPRSTQPFMFPRSIK